MDMAQLPTYIDIIFMRMKFGQSDYFSKINVQVFLKPRGKNQIKVRVGEESGLQGEHNNTFLVFDELALYVLEKVLSIVPTPKFKARIILSFSTIDEDTSGPKT